MSTPTKQKKQTRKTPLMIGLSLLATLARLRWPGIDDFPDVKLEDTRSQLQAAFTQALEKELSDVEKLDAAADIILLAAFLDKKHPERTYSEDVLKQLTQIYTRHRLEGAAITKVIALTEHEDVHAALAQVLEVVPEVHRKRVGRPYGTDPLAKSTRKFHGDIDAEVAKAVDKARGRVTFTNVVNDALVLWRIFNIQHD